MLSHSAYRLTDTHGHYPGWAGFLPGTWFVRTLDGFWTCGLITTSGIARATHLQGTTVYRLPPHAFYTATGSFTSPHTPPPVRVVRQCRRATTRHRSAPPTTTFTPSLHTTYRTLHLPNLRTNGRRLAWFGPGLHRTAPTPTTPLPS